MDTDENRIIQVICFLLSYVHIYTNARMFAVHC